MYGVMPAAGNGSWSGQVSNITGRKILEEKNWILVISKAISVESHRNMFIESVAFFLKIFPSIKFLLYGN